MLQGNYQKFYEQIIEVIEPKRVFTDALHTLAYGTDASFYRLVPKIVIKANSEEETIAIMKAANALDLPVTFRSGGTSLSGQAISDSILVALNWGFRKFKIAPDASHISLQPGIIGAYANKLLAPYGKKIGPDPASINAAMIGGIAANNASGMCCGTAQNSYKTLRSMKIMFSDGTVLDTASETSIESFKQSHAALIKQIESLAAKTKADEALSKKIAYKYKMKNTTGYSLNALIDYDDPIDIIQHLFIGSEGTLGMMSEVTYNTVIEHPYKASALVIYPNVEKACIAVARLKKAGEIVAAGELMDRAGLRSVEDKPTTPSFFKDLGAEACALLVETRASEKESLQQNIQEIKTIIEDIETVFPIEFTDKEEEYTLFWKIRKGLFPTVGAMRKIGTTVIIEDIAFPIDHLAAGTLELQELFQKHNYAEALIFGHALEGNLHFVFTQDFSTKEEVERYERFMDDVCQLTAVKYDGALKAEHGTGRNMAPYIELEWGSDAYALMCDIKKMFDPKGLLNPGVIINDDPKAHVSDLKPMPQTHPLVDKCIECGFCEPQCPSRDLTLTPRQRIVINREMSELKRTGANPARLEELEKLYDYDGEITCAACSLCSTACPVEIDTGKLTKFIREQRISTFGKNVAEKVANNFGLVTSLMKPGLSVYSMLHSGLGTGAMQRFTDGLRSISGGKAAKWTPYFPRAAKKIDTNRVNVASAKKVVYFPSCVSRTFAPSRFAKDERSLPEVVEAILTKANYEIIYPEDLDNLCCGQPFSSKGFKDQADKKLNELKTKLLLATNNGEYKIICDTSPCVYKMISEMDDERLKTYDPVAFVYDYLQEALEFRQEDSTVAVHTTCSSKKLGLESKMLSLAKLCSNNVVVPDNITCCGFAGDRGFNYPELNASALSGLKFFTQECDEGFSNSITCEIGLSEHSGKPYSSVLYLVDRCTRAK